MGADAEQHVLVALQTKAVRDGSRLRAHVLVLVALQTKAVRDGSRLFPSYSKVLVNHPNNRKLFS